MALSNLSNLRFHLLDFYSNEMQLTQMTQFNQVKKEFQNEMK